jgi:hypothetical protein
LEIDRLLSENPEQVGESRNDNERVLIIQPLTVTYEIFADLGVVLIYEARHWE